MAPPRQQEPSDDRVRRWKSKTRGRGRDFDPTRRGREPIDHQRVHHGGGDQEIDRFNKKLGNTEFVNKAPPAVIEKERQKLKEAEQAKQQVQAQVEKLKKL